jgi:hypothetical protein
MDRELAFGAATGLPVGSIRADRILDRGNDVFDLAAERISRRPAAEPLSRAVPEDDRFGGIGGDDRLLDGFEQLRLQADAALRLLTLGHVLDHHELVDPPVRRRLHASYCPQAPEDAAVLAQVAPFKVLLRQPGGNLFVAHRVVGGVILRRQQLIVAHGLQLFDRIADEIRHPLVGANDAAVLRRPKHRNAGEIEHRLEPRVPLGENLVLALQRRGRVDAAAFKTQ